MIKRLNKMIGRLNKMIERLNKMIGRLNKMIGRSYQKRWSSPEPGATERPPPCSSCWPKKLTKRSKKRSKFELKTDLFRSKHVFVLFVSTMKNGFFYSCSSDLKSNGKRRLNNQQQHVLKWTLGMWRSLNDKKLDCILEIET